LVLAVLVVLAEQQTVVVDLLARLVEIPLSALSLVLEVVVPGLLGRKRTLRQRQVSAFIVLSVVLVEQSVPVVRLYLIFLCVAVAAVAV
jgi:hypothetical protein